MTRMLFVQFALAVAALVVAATGCGGAAPSVRALPPVDCQYTTLPPRFCGPSEDEMLWRESNPQPQRICNGCFDNGDCLQRVGGQCVELPGEGCGYSAFVCVYPGDPCFGGGEACAEGECFNREGRAVCGVPARPDASDYE